MLDDERVLVDALDVERLSAFEFAVQEYLFCSESEDQRRERVPHYNLDDGKGGGMAVLVSTYVGPCLSWRLDHVEQGDLFCELKCYAPSAIFYLQLPYTKARARKARPTYLETTSFYLLGQAPQERQVLLLRPRGHAERQRPRRLDKVVREELAEFDGVEGFDQLKVAQHRLELRRGGVNIVLRVERCGSDRHRLVVLFVVYMSVLFGTDGFVALCG